MRLECVVPSLLEIRPYGARPTERKWQGVLAQASYSHHISIRFVTKNKSESLFLRSFSFFSITKTKLLIDE